MATSTTDITTSTPSTTDSVPCWECGQAVGYEQAVRTATGWQAIICPDCEGWVASHLGPIFTGERYR
jgi:hypothetical protein